MALSDMMSMSRRQDGGAMLIGKVSTVVPGVGHGLGWWPVILSDMMSMSRLQDGGARCGSRPRGRWPVILSDMMSMSIRIGKAATVVPGTGHGLGWWPVALSDMMSMSRLQDGGAMLIGKAVDGLQCGL